MDGVSYIYPICWKLGFLHKPSNEYFQSQFRRQNVDFYLIFFKIAVNIFWNINIIKHTEKCIIIVSIIANITWLPWHLEVYVAFKSICYVTIFVQMSPVASFFNLQSLHCSVFKSSWQRPLFYVVDVTFSGHLIIAQYYLICRSNGLSNGNYDIHTHTHMWIRSSKNYKYTTIV